MVSSIWLGYKGSRRGTRLECKGWRQEAALRLLNNNLDPKVGEDVEHLIIYGGTGKAARNWRCYDALVTELTSLENDETLLVQSGKPVGKFRTYETAPRVLIANSNLVGKWANWDYFRSLEKRGLIMYGQMTAGSWAYIGTQGIIQGTYETFAAIAREHFNGSLQGKIVLTAGLGGMGGAQPLAVTMNDGVCIAVEVDEARIDRRIADGYCEAKTSSLEEAVKAAKEAAEDKGPLSIALHANAADTHPELVERGFIPGIVTDQTAAHDALNGYVPTGYSVKEASDLRKTDPGRYVREAYASMGRQLTAMLAMQQRGTIAFEYGNNLRAQAKEHADVAGAFNIPGFVPAYIRPLFCEGKGPFRWVALSGNPKDIYTTDTAVKALFPDNASLHRWVDLAERRVPFQGLPSRVCWLGYGERERFALRINEMVREGEIEAPIVVTRDHLDSGSVASPNRETEGMLDGSDAIADWPVLNALLNCAAGADIVSFHHGGGVGIGYSLHAGMHVVLDGTKLAEEKAKRVFRTDPGIGILRHADAGYKKAIKMAKEKGLHIPLEQ